MLYTHFIPGVIGSRSLAFIQHRFTRFPLHAYVNRRGCGGSLDHIRLRVHTMQRS